MCVCSVLQLLLRGLGISVPSWSKKNGWTTGGMDACFGDIDLTGPSPRPLPTEVLAEL